METLKEILARIAPCQENRTVRDLAYRIGTTAHAFEITCPAADGQNLLAIFQDGRTDVYPA